MQIKTNPKPQPIAIVNETQHALFFRGDLNDSCYMLQDGVITPVPAGFARTLAQGKDVNDFERRQLFTGESITITL